MAIKFDDLREQLKKSIFDLALDKERYINFLDRTISFSKYSFLNQVLISDEIEKRGIESQSVAIFNHWNKVNRYVKKDSKGIPILFPNKKVNHVFTFEDTDVFEGKEDKYPLRWEYSEDKKEYIKAGLEEKLGVGIDFDNFITISRLLGYLSAKEFDSNNEIEKNLVEFSISYSVLKRCGFDRELILKNINSDLIDTINPQDFIKCNNYVNKELKSIYETIGKSIENYNEQIKEVEEETQLDLFTLTTAVESGNIIDELETLREKLIVIAEVDRNRLSKEQVIKLVELLETKELTDDELIAVGTYTLESEYMDNLVEQMKKGSISISDTHDIARSKFGKSKLFQYVLSFITEYEMPASNLLKYEDYASSEVADFIHIIKDEIKTHILKTSNAEIKQIEELQAQKEIFEHTLNERYVVEFNETNESDYINIPNLAGRELGLELIDSLEKLDEKIHNHNKIVGKDEYGNTTDDYIGSFKIYINKIVGENLADEIRIDLGDGSNVNASIFNLLKKELGFNEILEDGKKEKAVEHITEENTIENIEDEPVKENLYSTDNPHDLMPDEILRNVPALYKTENIDLADKVIHCAYIIPFKSNWTWYLNEYDKETNTAYGLVLGFEAEWGYFNLDELKKLGAERLILTKFPKTYREIKDTELVNQMSSEELEFTFNGKLRFKKDEIVEVEKYVEVDSNKEDKKIALNVGTEFVLAKKEDIKHINIIKTGGEVVVDGKIYNLYIGSTYEESRKVDNVLDYGGYKVYKLNDYFKTQAIKKDEVIEVESYREEKIALKEHFEKEEREHENEEEFSVKQGDIVYFNDDEYKVREISKNEITKYYDLWLDPVREDNYQIPIVSFIDDEDLLSKVNLKRIEVIEAEKNHISNELENLLDRNGYNETDFSYEQLEQLKDSQDRYSLTTEQMDLLTDDSIRAWKMESLKYLLADLNNHAKNIDLEMIKFLKNLDVKNSEKFSLIETYLVKGLVTVDQLKPTEENINFLAYEELFESLESYKYDNLESKKELEETTKSLSNFKITEEIIAEKLPPSERLKNNINAIKILKDLEKNERYPSEYEKEILAKYVGWGGLADVFDERTGGQWLEAREYLKENLTEDEYVSARESTLTAFYTPKKVIDGVYKALSNMGFQEGKVLEPSLAIGNFLGSLPGNIKAEFHGTEIDSISGRIAKQLYPSANIQICGFEDTYYEDGSFDVAVGNVPFGDIRVFDSDYNRYNLLIHDYFFVKALDKVKDGGIVAFITSKGSLDKANTRVREYLNEKADFVGAIRLPENVFKGLAGTEVTSDIIFLKKKDDKNHSHDFVNLSYIENGSMINEYFANNPNMIIGRMSTKLGRFGKETTCILDKNQDFDTLLENAINFLPKNVFNNKTKVTKNPNKENADESIPKFSYGYSEGKLYYRESRYMEKVDETGKVYDRQVALIEIRDILRELIELQVKDYPDEDIKNLQEILKTKYEAYNKKYDRLNSRGSSTAFSLDTSYPLLCSLENFDDDGNFIGLADIFYERTISPPEKVEYVESAFDSLLASLNEKGGIDLEYMAQITGKSKDWIIEELDGKQIFKEIGEDYYVTADDFLTGDVVTKLENAIEIGADKEYIKALESVQPKRVEAHEINVTLGACYIEPHFINKFMEEVFDKSPYSSIVATYNPIERWKIRNKSNSSGNLLVTSTYGTMDRTAYHLLETALNQGMALVKKKGEDGNKIVDKQATALANEKIELIKETFKEWIFKDSSRREEIVDMYNQLLNRNVTRRFDGSFLTFPNMTNKVKLLDHQKNAVARQLFGGNTLLAHVVGAGKTYTMIAGIMESKRLGMSNKAMIVVPNHLVGQWQKEFLHLYPSANILVPNKKDFTAKNRKKFCSKIATGNWDAIIVAHSHFERIGLNPLHLEKSLQEEKEKARAILEASDSRSYSVKALEKRINDIETQLEALANEKMKDDGIYFEELGVDRLYVDEAHLYKNLELNTTIGNIAGLNTKGSKKAFDMYLKTKYISRLTDNKGVVLATGTPVANSLVELYTMQRFLQADELEDLGYVNFDNWVATFGEIKNEIELNVSASDYKVRRRLKNYTNLPELMNIFHKVADVKTKDDLNLPVPKAKYINVQLESTTYQKALFERLTERIADVEAKIVDPTKDNMLSITNDGRLIALDERTLIEDIEPEHSKASYCTENAIKIYNEGKSEKLTQLIFCDKSVPAKDKFSVYKEVKNLLIEKGVAEEEIAFIHDFNTDEKKKQLFKNVNSGKIRFLIGSTDKMGAGMNVQERLKAIHHLDVPWRPADLEQREGRIIRRGNINEEVEIYRYITKGTFDAYSWQTIETKLGFIKQIMTNKETVRRIDDFEETELSASTAKALAIGEPLIRERAELENKVSRLKLLQSSYLKSRYEAEDNLYKHYPVKEVRYIKAIENINLDMEILKSNQDVTDDEFKIILEDKVYTDKKEAGLKLIQTINKYRKQEEVKIGEYRGFELYSPDLNIFSKINKLKIKGNHVYEIETSDDIYGNFSRLNNKLEKIENIKQVFEEKLKEIDKNKEVAKKMLEKPFDKEKELNYTQIRLKEVDEELRIKKISSIKSEFRNMVNEKFISPNEKNATLIREEARQQFYDNLNDEIKSQISINHTEIIGARAKGLSTDNSNIEILIEYTSNISNLTLEEINTKLNDLEFKITPINADDDFIKIDNILEHEQNKDYENHVATERIINNSVSSFEKTKENQLEENLFEM